MKIRGFSFLEKCVLYIFGFAFVLVITLPLFERPFYEGESRTWWMLSTFEVALITFGIAWISLITGVPISIFALRKRKRLSTWLGLIGIVLLYPIGILSWGLFG